MSEPTPQPFDGERLVSDPDDEHDAKNPELDGAPEEFSIRRRLHAPPATVFRAWTEPGTLTHWWGPAGLTAPEAGISTEVRPGGTWRTELVAQADGSRWTMSGVYREVRPPELLVFTWGVAPGEVPEAHPTALLTVKLTAREDGGTDLILHQVGHSAPEEHGEVLDGWTTCLDRLATLPGIGTPADGGSSENPGSDDRNTAYRTATGTT